MELNWIILIRHLLIILFLYKNSIKTKNLYI